MSTKVTIELIFSDDIDELDDDYVLEHITELIEHNELTLKKETI